MIPTLPTGRCEHGLNPKACLTCFRNDPQPAQARRPEQPREKPLPYNPIVAAVGARAGLQSNQAHPPQRHPKMIPAAPIPRAPGVAVDSEPARMADPEQPRTRGRMPRPVLHQGPHGPMVPAGTPGNRSIEPFDYAADQGRYKPIDGFKEPEGGVWVPPARESVIDRLPRHPSPGFAKPPGT